MMSVGGASAVSGYGIGQMTSNMTFVGAGSPDTPKKFGTMAPMTSQVDPTWGRVSSMPSQVSDGSRVFKTNGLQHMMSQTTLPAPSEPATPKKKGAVVGC